MELDPLNKGIAIAEIIILLMAAAGIGYLIARLLLQSRLRQLHEDIMSKQAELNDCRALPIIPQYQSAAYTGIKGAAKTVYPIEEPDRGLRQDLKVIEGIGPKIEEILNSNGIINYASLAAVPALRISAILKGAGPRFQIQDPTTWPEQASLAHEDKWDDLNELKEKLVAGKKQ